MDPPLCPEAGEDGSVTLKGQSHEKDLDLIDITRRSRPEKWLGVGFEFFFIALNCFIFNEKTGACFPIGWKKLCKCVAAPCPRFFDQ